MCFAADGCLSIACLGGDDGVRGFLSDPETLCKPLASVVDSQPTYTHNILTLYIQSHCKVESLTTL